MIEEMNCNVFESGANVILHSSNCFCAMNSGIARQVKLQFPEAYAADCKTGNGDKSKLGSFSIAKVSNEKFPDVKFVINLYAQFTYGTEKRQTSYDAMAEGLEAVQEKLMTSGSGPSSYILGIPYKIGCALGGGNWDIVEAIIYSIFGGSGIKVLICKYEP